MPLDEYRRKRRFVNTPEPPGKGASADATRQPIFVVQKHAARRLHYDLRLEVDGVLKSWAVPKGPALDPRQKRLAVEVEDHPREYANFEGVIPHGEYGAGAVIVWDRGTYACDDFAGGYQRGNLKIELAGTKLRGKWALVRLRSSDPGTASEWLLIKERDDNARPLSEYDVVAAEPQSVLSGHTVEQIVALEKQQSKSPKTTTRRTVAFHHQLDLTAIPDAQKSKLPANLAPQLAQSRAAVPAGDRWLHEIKFDGYRMVCRIANGQAKLLTRNQQDWTSRLPELAEAAAALPVQSALMDGEVVALLPSGASSFSVLQAALKERLTHGLFFMAFDLVHLNGYDLSHVALQDRKQLLKRVLDDADSRWFRYVDHIEGHGPAFFQQCVRAGLEGTVSKRRDKPRRTGRTAEWVKVKSLQEQTFWIGGFTLPQGSRTGLGALVLGKTTPAGLVHMGRVGTGLSDEQRDRLRESLDRRIQHDSPFVNLKRAAGVHWVRPDLAARVAFQEQTATGLIRHGVFRGLASSHPDTRPAAMEPTLSHTSSPPATRHAAIAPSAIPDDTLNQLAAVRLTHPNRPMFGASGITKLDLATYLVRVSDRLLAEVRGRPLSLVRCPDGIEGSCFFQKHSAASIPPQIQRVTIAIKGKTAEYLCVNDVAGLAQLAQIGVIELHVWGAKRDRPDLPDRLIFDLDPGDGVPWSRVIAAAIHVRDRLQRFHLQSFVRTSGGKGLHVVAPLVRRHPWHTVKDFARRFALAMAKESPHEFTARAAKQERHDRIYIDYLRNAQGATAIASYSPRARAGAPVATPLTWDELGEIEGGDHFTLSNIPARLATLPHEPWEELTRLRQSLTKKAIASVGHASAGR
jgi:bifunctional non-homologous end joining protein LigD